VEKTTNKPAKEEVVREFAPLGKYRVRLVRNPRRPNEAPVLDIREYVSAESFEGFTRRGIRIGDRAQIDLLRDTLMEVLEVGGFARSAPGALPLQ
jgi:hypothetical protein